MDFRYLSAIPSLLEISTNAAASIIPPTVTATALWTVTAGTSQGVLVVLAH